MSEIARITRLLEQTFEGKPYYGPSVLGALITDTSEAAWEKALKDLKTANQALVLAVQHLDDAILDKEVDRVGVSYYLMLHGTVQHDAYHAGQISLLRGQMTRVNPRP